MMPAIRVIAPGLLTTVQDLGRWGWQSRGVPVAGPMDPRAHRLANTLVENPADAAALEVTLLGPALEFEDERIVAVTGAEFEITLDGQPAPMNGAFQVAAGAVVRFGARLRGARAYLGVSGGIAVPPVFGSRATHVPSRMGGLDGRALRAGDVLPLGKRGRESFPSRAFSENAPDPFSLPDGKATVRVLPGPQQDRFAADALEVLQSAAYVVDTRSDRMGFRLHGPKLEHAERAEMLSDATAVGGLQVPLRGEPILLMADRQTTGGYPTLATVISADIGVAGQLAPGDGVSFVVASFGEAMAALIAQERTLMAFESSGRR
jgi:antagonist of KipI